MFKIEENLQLIRKITWSHVRKNPGLDFEDLFQVAMISILEAKDKYDPNRGKETTFIWYVVNNALTLLVSGEANKNTYECATEEIFAISEDPTPEQAMVAMENLEELTSSLSPEALEVYRLIINNTLYLPTDQPKKCKGIIKGFLKDEGWSHNRIRIAFQELKNITS